MLIHAKEVKLKNSKSITLRSPEPEEADELLKHLKKLFHQSYQNMNQDKNFWDSFPVEDERKIIADCVTSSSKFMLSAFHDDNIIGNLGCFGMGGPFLKFNARISMGIEADFQNIGLGTALLYYAIEMAKQCKLHRLELSVRTFNTAGIFLYEKVGFRRVGILKDTAFIDGKFCDEFMYEMILK